MLKALKHLGSEPRSRGDRSAYSAASHRRYSTEEGQAIQVVSDCDGLEPPGGGSSPIPWTA